MIFDNFNGKLLMSSNLRNKYNQKIRPSLTTSKEVLKRPDIHLETRGIYHSYVRMHHL